MLYLTTTDNSDAYTAYRTLNNDTAPDGGFFVPFSFPTFDSSEILDLRNKSFGQIIAEILGRFFSVQISGWDIDFSIGRNPVKLFPMNIKIVIAELWHNPKSNYSYTVHSLYKNLCKNEYIRDLPTQWVKIAVRIAVLFAIYGEMQTLELVDFEHSVDIAVPSDTDFTAIISAVYAKKMGLPIGNIICVCDDNSSVWDLIHRGIFTPTAADSHLLSGLERLIHIRLGQDEAKRFHEKCRNGRVYSIDEELLSQFNEGIFCAVTGKNRSGTTINSVYRSNSRIIDPVTARCHGGLQDYRARTGGSKLTLLLSEITPLDFTDEIAAATGISGEQIHALVSANQARE